MDENTEVEEEWDVDFYKSILDVSVNDYGEEFFTFLGPDYLLVHITDRKKSKRSTAVVSLKTKQAITSFNQLPQSIKKLLRPVNKSYSPPSPVVKAKKLSMSEHGSGLIEGGYAIVEPNYRYWVSLFRPDVPPIHYRKHTWNPVALTYSAAAGLCASADQLGQIHVWSAIDGRQQAVFKPINQQFHHVQWANDSSRILLATKPLSATSSTRYDFNQYGEVSTSFTFKDWKWTPVAPQETRFDSVPSIRDVRTGLTYYLDNDGVDDVVVRTDSATKFDVFESVIAELGENTVRKWGKPSCFRFLASATDGRLPFVVGTSNGQLLQFAIDYKNGRDVPRLTRRFFAHEAQINSVAQSPDKTLLASASLDGTVRIWRLEPVRTLADVSFKTDGTRVIDVGQDGDSGLQDGDGLVAFDNGPFYERIQKIQRGDYTPGQAVKIKVVRDGKELPNPINIRLVASADIVEPILNLFATKKEAWIAWTAEGFFNASPAGKRHVGWHVNRGRTKAAEFARVEQFSQQLYRPDLVNSVAANWVSVNNLADSPAPPSQSLDESHEAADDAKFLYSFSRIKPVDAKKALEKAPNTIEKFDRIRPPRLRVLSPFGTSETKADSVEIQFTVSTLNRLPIIGISITNNGRRQAAPPEQLLVDRKDGIVTTKYKVAVELIDGENHFAIHARHAAARSDTAEVQINRKATASANKELPRLFVLSVGISEYEDEALRLNFAHKDAIDFAEAWQKQEGRRYSKVQTRIITNKDATVDGILDGFDWLEQQDIGETDFVFVFFAGHALFDRHDTWIYGSTDLNPEKLTRTGITGERVQRLMEKELEQAGTVMLFLDTCHAGGVGASGGSKYRKHHSHGVDIWGGSQRRVLASSTQTEVSMENTAWENGAFTKCLLTAIDSPEADTDNNGLINIEELNLRTRQLVRRLTNNKQTPTASGQTLNHGVTELSAVRD